MKSIFVLGIILILVSAGLFYYLMTIIISIENIDLPHFIGTTGGITGGLGLGLIIGSIVGYSIRGTVIKAEEKTKQTKQLQKDKIALEKLVEELSNEEKTTE